MVRLNLLNELKEEEKNIVLCWGGAEYYKFARSPTFST